MSAAQRKPSHSATSPRPTTSSSLSAAAPSFAPASPLAPPPDVSTIDEFAQTGAYQDDLFDDVVPVDESMHTRPPDDLFADEFTPVEQPVVQQVVREQSRSQQRGRGGGEGGRGRGRGRGRGGEQGGAEQPRAQAQAHPQPTVEGQPKATPLTAPQAPSNAPTGPRQTTVAPVRGPRQSTGGIRKPKLTDAELAAKMAAITLKNASLTEAHARAEADAASFAEQESRAKLLHAEKAKAERKDRQQMMGEREKNRMRKLKAMEGREWDAEKEEGDFGKGGKFDGKGFKGDEEGWTDGREYLVRDAPRGGGAQRGSGRGGKEAVARVPRLEEFPALGSGGKGEGKSWADQVESATPS